MRRAENPSGRTDIRPTVQEQRDQGLLKHTPAGNGYPNQQTGRDRGLIAVVCAGAVVWAVSSKSESTHGPGRQPRVEGGRLRRGAGAGAPPPLAKLYANGDEILDGGVDELHRKLAERARLSGGRQRLGLLVRPVPVRVPALPGGRRRSTASGSPSSASTPTTRRRRPTTSSTSCRCPIRASATPTATSATSSDSLRRSPSTAFYDADGKLVFVKQGPYASRGRPARRHPALRGLSAADNRAWRARLRSRSARASRGLLALLVAGRAGGAVRADHRALDRAQRLDRPGDRAVDRLGARPGRRRRRAAGDHPHRHPGRARGLDAGDRQGHHRRPDAGRRLRVSRTAPARPRRARSSPRPPTSRRWRRRPTSARRAR